MGAGRLRRFTPQPPLRLCVLRRFAAGLGCSIGNKRLARMQVMAISFLQASAASLARAGISFERAASLRSSALPFFSQSALQTHCSRSSAASGRTADTASRVTFPPQNKRFVRNALRASEQPWR